MMEKKMSLFRWYTELHTNPKPISKIAWSNNPVENEILRGIVDEVKRTDKN